MPPFQVMVRIKPYASCGSERRMFVLCVTHGLNGPDAPFPFVIIPCNPVSSYCTSVNSPGVPVHHTLSSSKELVRKSLSSFCTWTTSSAFQCTEEPVSVVVLSGRSKKKYKHMPTNRIDKDTQMTIAVSFLFLLTIPPNTYFQQDWWTGTRSPEPSLRSTDTCCYVEARFVAAHGHLSFLPQFLSKMPVPLLFHS